jgi:methionyl aminopeptidase
MIRLKSRREIDIIRRAGRILAQALKLVENAARPGMTTLELDKVAEDHILAHDGECAFKGYHGFPNCCCISINEELVHGIPGRRKLANGDLVSVDIGVKLENYYSDAAVSFGVGEISDEAHKLLDVTRASLERAIAVVRPGVRLSEIGHAVQDYVEAKGFSVVRQFVGHGIGRELWEEPQVPNFWDDGSQSPADSELEKGTVIAIEPMVNAGTHVVRTLSDNWTVVTKDGRLCAHFEHTVAITSDGFEVLTTDT